MRRREEAEEEGGEEEKKEGKEEEEEGGEGGARGGRERGGGRGGGGGEGVGPLGKTHCSLCVSRRSRPWRFVSFFFTLKKRKQRGARRAQRF